MGTFPRGKRPAGKRPTGKAPAGKAPAGKAPTTVAELGLGGGMSVAAANWQDRIGALGANPGEADLFDRLDTVLKQL